MLVVVGVDVSDGARVGVYVAIGVLVDVGVLVAVGVKGARQKDSRMGVAAISIGASIVQRISRNAPVTKYEPSVPRSRILLKGADGAGASDP